MISHIPRPLVRSWSKPTAASSAVGILNSGHARATTAALVLPRGGGGCASSFGTDDGRCRRHRLPPAPLPLPCQRRSLHLAPRESDHLLLHSAGRLAQYRLARGLRLNVPEARALIAMQMMEMVRNGSATTVDGPPVGGGGGGAGGVGSGSRTTVTREGTVSSLMAVGTRLLGRNQVLPGVASMVREVQVEATFPDGTKLLTVHDPIGLEDGDLALALEGSFLPVPDASVFRAAAGGDDADDDGSNVPGQTLVSATMPDIEINAGRSLIEMAVTNTGDRPIQVGSHYRELSSFFLSSSSSSSQLSLSLSP